MFQANTIHTMTDVMTPEQRHRCMSHIRGKNTKPEMIVRKYLFAQGFRYRLHVKALPGTPDIVLPKYRTVIFVNGCFWHGHEGCKYYCLPHTNTDFWKAKIERNIERDKQERLELRDMGWHVIQLWECMLKPKERENSLKGVVHSLHQIMLINYGAKGYGFEEEDGKGLMVAEEKGGY